MEITSTTITQTARHSTERGNFNIDFVILNGKIERIQLNIFKPHNEDEEEVYVGSVHYEHRNLTCHIPWCENVADYLEESVGFISQIIENTKQNETEEEQEETSTQSR